MEANACGSLWDWYRPLHYVSKVAGLAPKRSGSAGKYRPTLLSTLHVCAAMVLLFTSYPQLMRHYLTADIPLVVSICCATMVTTMVATTVVNYADHLLGKWSRVRGALVAAAEADRAFLTASERAYGRHFAGLPPRMILALASGVAVYAMDASRTERSQIWARLVGVYLLDLLDWVECFRLVFVTTYLKARLRQVNGKLRVLARGAGDLVQLRGARRFHGAVCDVGLAAGSAFSLQLLVSMTDALVLVVCLGVVLVECLRRQWFAAAPLPCLWLARALAKLGLLALYCGAVGDEAARTPALAHRLTLAPAPGRGLVREARLFTRQARLHGCGFSACGFFDVDRRTFCSIVSAIVSYTVLTVQLLLGK